MSLAVPAIVNRIKTNVPGVTGVFTPTAPTGRELNAVVFTESTIPLFPNNTFGLLPSEVDTVFCVNEDATFTFQVISDTAAGSQSLAQLAYRWLSQWSDESIGIMYANGVTMPSTLSDPESDFWLTNFQINIKFQEV
jgi:hypothetical protein